MSVNDNQGTVEIVGVPDGYELRIELGGDYAARLSAHQARALSMAVVDAACAAEHAAATFDVVRTADPDADPERLGLWSARILAEGLQRNTFGSDVLELLPMMKPENGAVAVGFASLGTGPRVKRTIGAFDTHAARYFALVLLRTSFEAEYASALYRAMTGVGIDEETARGLIDDFGEDSNFWGDETDARTVPRQGN